jgi:hypothetical protein
MEIRKQILGIAFGFLITISFITPVYSYYSSYTNISDLMPLKIPHYLKIGHNKFGYLNFSDDKSISLPRNSFATSSVNSLFLE